MRRYAACCRGEACILCVWRRGYIGFLAFGDVGRYLRAAAVAVAGDVSQTCRFRSPFGNDVRCSCQSLVAVSHTVFAAEALRCPVAVGYVSGHDYSGKRLKAFLACHSGACAFAGLEGCVDIFHGSHAVGGIEPFGQLCGHFTGLLYGGAYKFAAGLKLAFAFNPRFNGANLHFVERAGEFLAVAAYKRHGSALVEQPHRGLDAFFRQCARGGHCPYDTLFVSLHVAKLQKGCLKISIKVEEKAGEVADKHIGVVEQGFIGSQRRQRYIAYGVAAPVRHIAFADLIEHYSVR